MQKFGTILLTFLTIAITAKAQSETKSPDVPDNVPLPYASRSFPVGKKVKYYNLKDIEGNIIKAEDLKGKIVVLNFWFTNCPACRKETPALNELAFEYARQPDVVFIAIALDHRWDIRDFLKTHPLSYSIIEDGQIYADRYGVHEYPTNVVLDRQGKVLFSDAGFASTVEYWLRKNIEAAKKN